MITRADMIRVALAYDDEPARVRVQVAEFLANHGAFARGVAINLMTDPNPRHRARRETA